MMELKRHNRYGFSPITDRKDFTWPGGKRMAFYVALNVEHFSFGDGLGLTATATSTGPQPDVRNFGWRDYGLRVGIWRIFDMMDELKLPMCHLINSVVCEEMPQIVARIRTRGDEVVGHGYTNSERQSDMDADAEAQMIAHTTATLEKRCGRRPYGWMGPWISETPITPDLLQENGYTFVMDWPADDQPFWMNTRAGRIMSIPYPIELNDTPTMVTRAQSATDFHRMIIDQFEEMLRLSESQSLVCGLSLHTFCTGQPFRLTQVRQALQAVLKHPRFDNVWVTTPGEIAKYAASLPAGCVP
jgi:polysaccharide deacetylase